MVGKNNWRGVFITAAVGLALVAIIAASITAEAVAAEADSAKMEIIVTGYKDGKHQPLMQPVRLTMDGKPLAGEQHQRVIEVATGNHTVCIADTRRCQTATAMTGKTVTVTIGVEQQ